jgi:hypothetical protein
VDRELREIPTQSQALDLSIESVSDNELRRRAAEGDQRAAAELARRGSMLVGAEAA